MLSRTSAKFEGRPSFPGLPECRPEGPRRRRTAPSCVATSLDTTILSSCRSNQSSGPPCPWLKKQMKCCARQLHGSRRMGGASIRRDACHRGRTVVVEPTSARGEEQAEACARKLAPGHRMAAALAWEVDAGKFQACPPAKTFTCTPPAGQSRRERRTGPGRRGCRRDCEKRLPTVL